MAGLYMLFVVIQILSLLFIHITASETVNYRAKIKKKHPECAPKNLWDFLSFRYYLRSPKVNHATKALYYLNIANLGFLVFLVVTAITFCFITFPYERLSANGFNFLPFLPFAISAGNIIFCQMVNPLKLGLKFYLRRWLLADLLGLVAATIVYFIFQLFQ